MTNEILKLVKQDLSSIPFHNNLDDISRWIALGSEYHIAIHQINTSQDHPDEYIKPHKHNAEELNIILSNDEIFQYRIMINDEENIINAPSVVMIPKDTIHSANVVKGKGFYICIVFQKNYEATE